MPLNKINQITKNKNKTVTKINKQPKTDVRTKKGRARITSAVSGFLNWVKSATFRASQTGFKVPRWTTF